MSAKRVQSKRLTELVHTPFRGARVNREAGTIADVLICGTTSANGRDYPVAVLRRDCARYEGRPVNCDHGRESTVERRLGWFTDVRPGPDGRPRGTLNLLRSHPVYERVMEAAERNPALYGFSHVALCKTRPGTGGREVVEAIERVESIDLVAEPATTQSLFEGRGTVAKTTLLKLVEGVLAKLSPARAKPARKWLVAVEDDAGMAPMLDAPVDEPAEGADPDQAIDDAFKQAMHAQVDALLDESHTLAEFMSKCRELYKSRAKIMGKAEPADAPAADAMAAPEAKSVKLTDVIAECAAMGLKDPTGKQLATLAEIPTAAGRALVIESMQGAGPAPERPQSAGRGRIDPGAAGSTGRVAEGKPPADPKAFAEWLK